MDGSALLIDVPLVSTRALPRVQKHRRINPVRVALLLSALVHVLAMAACTLFMISVRDGALHAAKLHDPLAVTLVTDLSERCDETIPQLVLEPRPELSDLAQMQTQRITEIETVEHVEPKTEENGFRDAEDGGTLKVVEQTRSGGGGGEDVPSTELGHVRIAREDWSHTKVKAVATARVIGAGGDSGNRGGAPGVLNAPGSGSGLGNGAGSGALGSSGSGTGSGSGRDGRGAGSGMGAQAPAGITRNAEPLQIFGGSYPSDAKRMGHEGLVKVDVEVLTDGHVGTVKLAQSSGYDELDRAALAAATDWTFRPALNDGAPIVMWRRVPYRYTLLSSR